MVDGDERLLQKLDVIQGIIFLFSSQEGKTRIISINRGRLGRGAEDVSLKNQELMS